MIIEKSMNDHDTRKVNIGHRLCIKFGDSGHCNAI